MTGEDARVAAIEEGGKMTGADASVSNEPDDHYTVLKVKLPLKTPRWHRGYYFAPVPASMIETVGQITVGWALYENIYSQMLAALAAENKSKDDWALLTGKKRRARFMRELLIFLKGDCASTHHAKWCLDMAADLQRSRNLISHGSIAAKIKGDGKSPLKPRLQ